MTAIPAPGYHFANWSDNSTDNPRTDTNITANLSVTASFELTNPDANSNGILDTWEIEKFGNGTEGMNAAGDDPDHDGLSNLMEYALNTHPLNANASPLTFDLVAAEQGRHARLTVPKNPAATNLTFSVEVTGDVGNGPWTSSGTTLENNTSTELRVRDNSGSSTSSRRFMRLKVTANESFPL